MVTHVESDDVSSESGAAKKEPPKEAVTGTGAKADNYNGTKEVAIGVTSKAIDVHEHQVSPFVVWLVNGTKSLTRHPGCKASTGLPIQTRKGEQKMLKKEDTNAECDTRAGANAGKLESTVSRMRARPVCSGYSVGVGQHLPVQHQASPLWACQPRAHPLRTYPPWTHPSSYPLRPYPLVSQ
jgi:hypothetical protein